MKLYNLLDPLLLKRMVAEGYVRIQNHPSLPLAIYNYTEKAQYERVWNDATSVCRGLIVHAKLGDIMARPFRKFHNYGENEAGTPELSASAVVTDKADGSLGILYPSDEGWSVATRGSFCSEQAIHATRVWQERYQEKFDPVPGWTYLFEIVYPRNRIVLDYGDTDDLIHLGCVNVETGQTVLPDPLWPGPVVDRFAFRTLADALAAEPRDNAEGLVVWFPDTDKRVKIKQDDYVALHALLTTCTARTIWLHLAARACPPPPDANPNYYATRLKVDPADAERALSLGDDWRSRLLDDVPDEFYQWVKNTIARLENEVSALRASIMRDATRLREKHGTDRRAIAIDVRTSKHPHFGGVLRYIDGHNIDPYLWQAAKPAHETPFMARALEDVA